MSNENTFRYTYCAQEQQEVLSIRSRYLPQEETKLDELKRLDRTVQNSGVPQALCVGVAGCLIFGLGMCLAMEVIGSFPWLGILLGIAGITGMLFAYPVYRKIFTRTKEQYAPRILQLSAELTGEA